MFYEIIVWFGLFIIKNIMDNTGVKQTEVVNGANPTMLYAQYMDYLLTLCKVMKKTYTSRTRDNKPITWAELDELNNKLHNDLDIIMCGHKNVQNENKQLKSEKMKSIRLTESELRDLIKEALNELDWKTGVSAAKSAEKKKDPRKDKFLKYATDRMKSQYPNRKHEGEFQDGTMTTTSFGPYLNTKYGYMNAYGTSGEYDTEYHKSFGDRGVKGYGKMGFSNGIHTEWGEPTNSFVGLEPSEWDWDNMSNDMENYYTGKSKYEKGKGWTKDELEESITRAIHKYLR